MLTKQTKLTHHGEAMPKEKTTSHLEIILKDLGSLKAKILLFLAENPDKNAQAIQKELGYPPPQYPNILKAVKELEKLGLVQSEKSVSAKNLPMKLYSCNDKGILYVIAKNPNANSIKILRVAKNQEGIAKDLIAYHDLLGEQAFIAFIRDLSQFLPMIAKDGFENTKPFIFIKGFMGARLIDPKRKKGIAKEAIKRFPEIEKLVKEWKKALNELV
jgi:DNA-binding PadR family transcriptional regulator